MSDPPVASHSVARQYDRWASVYDWLWRRYIDQTLPVLARQAAIQPGERVLDVGCGTGAFEKWLVESGARNEIVGVDLSKKMLGQARAKLNADPQVTFERADVHALPFPESRFDVIVSASTFHYFDAPVQALREMARVLRPGGRLVVLDWCRDFWTCRVMDVVLAWMDPAYQHCFTLDELCGFLDDAALAIRTAERLRVGWIWGMMIVDARRPSLQ